ncbi:MAG TPA: LCP family protein [Actinokineospora sp.]|jgi:LCP family protein required for cell wall assembly|nr:LCP family protein [Actinokineospora sp.]
MTLDKTESLIRDAITDQAARAVDADTVLRELRKSSRRTRPAVLVFAAAAVVIAVVSAVVIPGLVRGERPAQVGTPDTVTKIVDQTILVMGMDRFAHTDVVMLVRLTAAGLTAISVPRDAFVEIPGHGKGKANSAYERGRLAAEQRGLDGPAAMKAGAETAMATFGSLTGVPIDHYAVIDMSAIASLVDAVGGVEVCLNAATKDPTSGANFTAGSQTLAGAQALAFVRQRHHLPNGDLDRVKRQQALFKALATKLGSSDLRPFVGAVRDHVVTDMDLVGLAELGSKRAVRTGMVPVGAEVNSPSAGFGFEMSAEKVHSYVTEMFGSGEQGGGGDTPGPACVD